MAKKIEALVLRNICTKADGKIKKGETAKLTGKEMEHYVRIGAVQRPEYVPGDEPVIIVDSAGDQAIEGGDA